MRTTIHLCQRGVTPLRCIACGEIAPTGQDRRGRIPAICNNRTDWDTIYVGHAEYRRCIDKPDKAPKRLPTPNKTGYYWAEWRIPEDGTFPDDWDFSITLGHAEVVEVFWDENDNGDRLMVYVPGIEKKQPLDNFVWRSGLLTPPS